MTWDCAHSHSFKYVPFNSCSIFNLIMSSGSGNIYFRSEFWWFKHSSQCVSCPTSLTLQVIQTRLSPPQTPVPHWSPPRRRTTWSRPTRYIQYSIFPISNSLIYQAMEDGYSGDPLDMRAQVLLHCSDCSTQTTGRWLQVPRLPSTAPGINSSYTSNKVTIRGRRFYI